jgi:RNA polymerase sigma-70 factor (ECF subfamily)
MAETFLRAVRAAHSYDESRGPARGWLFRIAQNVLRDHRRRDRRTQPVPLAALRDLVAPGPSAEERLLWEEETATLLAAVADLAPPDQELIALRYGSGLATAAIGELIGVREQAVRTRLWRALRRLRARLEGLR